MTICIPIVENRGLLSPVSPHLDAAPELLLVDTTTLAYRTIPNAPADGGDGWSARRALGGQPVDALIVSAGGASALAARTGGSPTVYGAAAGRVADALADLIAGRLLAVREPAAAEPGA